MTRFRLILLLMLLVPATPAAAYQRSQDFSQDPGWQASGNRLVSDPCPTTSQDFGYSPTHFAGGAGTGEIGGTVWRSLTPAWYGAVFPQQTLANYLSAEGRLTVTGTSPMSSALLGWFSGDSREWRMSNSIMMRFDDVGGDSSKVNLYVEYGTRNWRTQGLVYSRTGSPFQLDVGHSYGWRLSYDPTGSGGSGTVTLAIDGQAVTMPVRSEDRADGASFDHFGLVNEQIPGSGMSLFIDDLVLDGQSQSFGQDPGWDGNGNRIAFPDCRQNAAQDFGFSPDAGGRAGGLIWRTETTAGAAAWYADAIERLGLNDALHAQGNVDLTQASSDSATYIGWFNTQSHGDPPTDFLGIRIEGPSRIGQYFRPVYRVDSDGSPGTVAPSGPIIVPNGVPLPWSLDYTPLLLAGGTITGQLGGQPFSLAVPASDRTRGAGFDRFGIRSMTVGGHSQTVYFDDLSYTAGAGLLPPILPPLQPAVSSAAGQRGPSVAIGRRSIRLSRAGSVVLQIRCLAAHGSCSGLVRLRTAGKVREHARGRPKRLHLGQGGFRLGPSQEVSLRIPVSGRGRRALRRLRRLSVRALATAFDDQGHGLTTFGSFTLFPRRG